MGFYYDDQLNNKSNTIRLYGTKDGSSYIKEPLAKAIFNEDFEFEVANSWSDFDGGNFAEGLFNQLKPFAPYMDFITDRLKEIDFSNTDKMDGLTGMLSRGTHNTVNWITSNEKTASDYLNKALVVQGTRFVYFAGTSIGLGNLGMKFTLMYDPVSGKTVKEQLEKLMEFVIGDYEKPSGTSSKGDDISSFIGWQNPPGGFTMDIKNVNNVLKGTVKLEFGDLYKIDNLVIKACNVSLSRVKANRIDDGEPTSLYGEVALAFQPAGMIVKDNLMEYLEPIDDFEEE